MKVLYMLFIGAFAASFAACSKSPSETSADSTKPGGFFDSLKPEPKITVPAGTRLRVALIEGVSTNKSSPGDRFSATLAEPVIVDGKMVLEKGTKVRGSVVDVRESGRVKGRASIQLTLNEIVRDGKSVAISTKPFIAVAEATKKRDAAIIGGGAGVGAAIGALAGGGKGAAVGAAIGGGAGTGTVLATRGKEIHYGPETRLSFTLTNSVEI
ncbi:MAG TPA: hypothetical protein VE422_37440 [Terriglobia bacterium]|nr:hypothetical protein [Terriglobia bacterium]